MSQLDAVIADGGMDRQIVSDAAAWLVRLHGGEMDAVAQAAFERWRSQSPAHERAWKAANELALTFGAVPSHIGMPVLERRLRNRRAALKTLAVVAVLAPTSWLAWRNTPWREWNAGEQTAAGERRHITLADGSSLHLNTNTAVDVVFDDAWRRIVLHRGEVLIETAADPATAPRPFVVQTRHGIVRALGTRFLVRQLDHDDKIHVAVFEHRVDIQPTDGASLLVSAGEQSDFSSRTAGTVQLLQANADAWSRGMLIADRQRLGDFLAELARHRSGIVRCDPAVADLRISGVFELDDTARALSILQETLPVSVQYRTRYWVSVGPRLTGDGG